MTSLKIFVGIDARYPFYCLRDEFLLPIQRHPYILIYLRTLERSRMSLLVLGTRTALGFVTAYFQ